MPQYIVTERPKTDSSGETDGKDASRDEVRRFHVLVASSDYQSVNSTVVRAYAPLPAIGSPHPNSAGLFCRGVNVTQVGVNLYEAEATYFSPTGGSNPNDSPTLQPATVKWSHVTTDEEIDQDAEGKPIITVTGESFDPPIRRQFGDLQLTHERNVIYFDPVLATEYLFTTNSDTFLGFMPGTVLCTQFSADAVTDNPDFIYWRRSIVFQFRRGAPNTTDAKAWYRRIRAEGYYVKIGFNNDTFVTRAYDGEGKESVKPVLHDKTTGQQITNPQDAQWYEFKIYQSKPFALLLTL